MCLVHAPKARHGRTDSRVVLDGRGTVEPPIAPSDVVRSTIRGEWPTKHGPRLRRARYDFPRSRQRQPARLTRSMNAAREGAWGLRPQEFEKAGRTAKSRGGAPRACRRTTTPTWHGAPAGRSTRMRVLPCASASGCTGMSPVALLEGVLQSLAGTSRAQGGQSHGAHVRVEGKLWRSSDL